MSSVFQALAPHYARASLPLTAQGNSYSQEINICSLQTKDPVPQS